MLPWSLTASSLGYRRGSVHFLLHRGRLSNQESSEGPNLRPDKHRGEVRSQHSPDTGELLGHVLSQPSEPTTVGPSGWWVQTHTTPSCLSVRFCCYSVLTPNSWLQVSLPWGPLHHHSGACGRLLWTSVPLAPQTFHLQNVLFCGSRNLQCSAGPGRIVYSIPKCQLFSV